MLQHVRTLLLCTLLLFFLSFFRFGFSESPLTSSVTAAFDYSQEYPDFGQYVSHWTLTKEELDLEHRRLIIVGDIHAMKPFFEGVPKLLDTVSYRPSDLIIHLGDTIVKGLNTSSILQQFTDANVTGVRGNHEQKVIEWRGWIEWVESQEGGKQWLDKLERSKAQQLPVLMNSRKHRRKWPIPKGWKFMGKHYRIARSLTAPQYSYLKSLPLVIHLPSLHTHLVHAGILPFNPMVSPTNSEQPLAHVPKAKPPPPPQTEQIRAAQEIALLTDIDQNTDPWVLLNMRSILNNNKVSSKSKKGTPWTNLWDMTMKRCRGYHRDDLAVQSDVSASASGLLCLPINVVYGHAASRGLDIKRWSFGLDTGCVYGRNLTAMIIPNTDGHMDTQTRSVPFGEHGSAQLVSVPCS